MVEGIIVVGPESISVKAPIRVGLVVEFLGVEHVVESIHVHWHGLIAACQNVPSTHVLIGGTVLVNLIAL